MRNLFHFFIIIKPSNNFQHRFTYTGKNAPAIKRQYCENCNGLADMFCPQCKAPYCTVKCINDSAGHVAHCGDNLQKVQEIKSITKVEALKPVPTQPETIPYGAAVRIMFIVDYGTVFVRPMNAAANEDYILTINKAAAEGRRAERISAMPLVGGWVLAPHQEAHGRAMVLKYNSENEIFCGFIDFGYVAIFRLDELKEISMEVKTRRWLNKKIWLEKVESICINNKQFAELKILLPMNDKLYMKYDTDIDEDDDETDECVLYTRSGKSVNAKLRELFKKSMRTTIPVEGKRIFYSKVSDKI